MRVEYAFGDSMGTIISPFTELGTLAMPSDVLNHKFEIPMAAVS